MMNDPRFRARTTLRQEWIRYRDRTLRSDVGPLRAGVPGAYLRPVLLPVPHQPQERVSESVPQCAAMVLRYYEQPADLDRLTRLLQTDELYGTPGQRLARLRIWGYRVSFPRE